MIRDNRYCKVGQNFLQKNKVRIVLSRNTEKTKMLPKIPNKISFIYIYIHIYVYTIYKIHI